MPKDLILCVDDEAIVLRSCSIAVAQAGYRVAVAENGAAGLEAFMRLRDDVCLVLADVVMPGKINGIEMAVKILAIAPDMKILVMSGYSDEILEVEGHSRLPLIRKPFLPDALMRKIRLVLGTPDSAASES